METTHRQLEIHMNLFAKQKKELKRKEFNLSAEESEGYIKKI